MHFQIVNNLRRCVSGCVKKVCICDDSRHDKNWKWGDELRDKLIALGVDLADKKI